MKNFILTAETQEISRHTFWQEFPCNSIQFIDKKMPQRAWISEVIGYQKGVQSDEFYFKEHRRLPWIRVFLEKILWVNARGFNICQSVLTCQWILARILHEIGAIRQTLISVTNKMSCDVISLFLLIKIIWHSPY